VRLKITAAPANRKPNPYPRQADQEQHDQCRRGGQRLHEDRRQPEKPIFTRSFDFLARLLPAANHRLGSERLEHLTAADEALDRLRLYLRLAAKWDWLYTAH